MAKTRRARKTARATKTTRAARPARAAATPAGPLTLAQARALAAPVAPAGAARRVRAAATAPTSPADVGRERRRLEVERRREKRRRTQEYTATLRLLKKRGVKAPAGATRARGAAAAAVVATPLQVFAEGDSWFDYPKPFFGGGVIPRLENLIGVPILNLAKAGDEVRFMLGVDERKELITQLRNGCPAGGPWDALLFSGGGNDIVDDPMCLWVRDFDPAVPPESLIHQPRFDTALALVRAGYEDLIAVRDAVSPTTHLVFHCYDFALPDGRGICNLGPWLKPTFDLRGFPSQAARFAVVKAMLQQFALMLQTLAAGHQRVSVINGQGLLAPQTSAWDNELHPEGAGFAKHAALFRQTLKAVFPGRVF